MNLIKAAASGKYIIATDVCGNADVVKQTGSGVLVPLNDDKAMAAEIKRAMLLYATVKKANVHQFGENEIILSVFNQYLDN